MKKTILIIVFILLIVPVILANNSPKLIDGGAQPPFGKPGLNVVYRVKYADAGGNAPTSVKVCFPNECKEMKKTGGDYKTGAIYEYSQQQYESLEFHFEASDGTTEIRFPDYEGSGLSPVNILTEIPEKNKVALFSKDSNKPLWNFDTGKDWVHAVAISDDGDYIAVKTTDYIYLFSKESNVPLWKHQCIEDTGKNENPAGWISISANGDYVAAACPNQLFLFSKEGKKLWYFESEKTKQGSIYSLSMSSTGDYIVLGTMGTNMIYLFSKDSNNPIWSYEAKGDVHGLSISPDGNYIAAGAHCPDRRAYLFSKDSNIPLISYVSSEDSPVWTADVSNNGNVVYGLDGAGIKGMQSNLFLMSSGGSKPFREYFVSGWVRSVSIADNGNFAAAGSGGGYVYFIDVTLEQELWKYNIGKRVGSVSMSRDSKYIAAGSKDKSLYLFSAENSNPLWSSSLGEWVNTVAISGDGDYIIAGTGALQYLAEGQHSTAEESQMTPVCGDTVCVSGENSENCPQDCKGHKGEVKKAVCGDGICDYQLEHCPQDCREELKRNEERKESAKQTFCGNDLCEPHEENKDNCPEDCVDVEKDKTKGEKIFQAIINFFKRLFR